MAESPRLHVLTVGQPYIPGRTEFPEAVQYQYRSGAHELLMWLRSPSPREVQSIRRGSCSFALYTEGDLLVFLYEFEPAIPWSDAPFSIHLLPEDQRTIPPPAEMAEPRALLQIVLVDAATGLVQVLRAVTFSPAFTAALHLAIRRQAERGWPGDAEYDRQLQALYRRFPTSMALRRAAQSWTAGGR